MSRPLPSGDPTRLGPFRLTARLVETSAGIVFLGEDEQGRQASVAVLTKGAAQDAAARDRFRAAILGAVPGSGRFPGLAPGDPAPVVAAQPEGPAPWVATLYEPDGSGGAGAERFLDPVMLRGVYERQRPASQAGQAGQAGRVGQVEQVEQVRHGPNFRPYWSGGGPAVGVPRPVAPAPPGPVGPRRPERGLKAAVLSLAAMLALLSVLMLLVFGCQPEVDPPPPDPPSDTYRPPSPPPVTPSPEPSPPSVSPSPSRSGGEI